MKTYLLRKSIMVLLLAFPFYFCFGQEFERINNSSIAFTVGEKDLLPENIAYDPTQNAYFVGSTRKGKIIKIKDGQPTDFISSKSNGLWMIIGMKVDSERRILWVCSSGGSNLEGYTRKDETDGRPAGIFKFNLDDGKLINKFTLEGKEEVHFFNDLVVARNGDLYATHMFNESAIYKIANGSNSLELFLKESLIKYPNGITLADNQSVLFVAHSEGLARVDINTKKVTNLKMPEGIKVDHQESIDGLYYYKWSLIGIQSDLDCVTRYYLNEEGNGIKDVKLLEKNHPVMDHPTSGVLIGNMLYYVANSQFERISDDGVLYSMEKLYEPVILKVNVQL